MAKFEGYTVETMPGGGIVYELKEGNSRGEPPHRICPDCKDDGVRAFLQPHGAQVLCHRCDRTFQLEPRVTVAGPVPTGRGGFRSI